MTTLLQSLVERHRAVSEECETVLARIHELASPILEAEHKHNVLRSFDQLTNIDYSMVNCLGSITFVVYDHERGQTDHYSINTEDLFADDPIATIKDRQHRNEFTVACAVKGLGVRAKQEHLDRIRELEAEMARLVEETW